MTRHLEVDRLIEDWLSDLPSRLPDRVVDAVVDELDRTPQWKRFRLPWRDQMNRLILAAGAAAAVVVVAALALGLNFNANQLGFGGAPSPSPSAEPSPPSEPSPTAEQSPTAEPAATVRPTSTPDAGLPVGDFVLEPDGDFSEEDSGMALTVTIPSSNWTFWQQWALLEKNTGLDDQADATIAFWAFPGQEFYVPADACRMTSTRPDTPATTADELAAALAARTPPDVSEPVDVTVGGYEGKFITLHVPEEVPNDCEQGDFVYYVTGPDNFWRNSQNPGQVEELWILDVEGTIVIINALHPSDIAPELVEELRSIAQSATFDMP